MLGFPCPRSAKPMLPGQPDVAFKIRVHERPQISQPSPAGGAVLLTGALRLAQPISTPPRSSKQHHNPACQEIR